MKRKVQKLFATISIKKDEKNKEYIQKKHKNAIEYKRKNCLCTSKTKDC